MGDSAPARVVVVVADDLVWSTRLLSQATAAGASGSAVRDLAGLDAALAERTPDLVVVDLSARRFDGVAAVTGAVRAGALVVAVAQHAEHDLRRRALAAGARRVYAYAKVYEDGIAILRQWLTVPEGSGGGAIIGRGPSGPEANMTRHD